MITSGERRPHQSLHAPLLVSTTRSRAGVQACLPDRPVGETECLPLSGRGVPDVRQDDPVDGTTGIGIDKGSVGGGAPPADEQTVPHLLGGTLM